MTNLEIPLKTRSVTYRFFEMLPGMLSYGAILLLIVLSLINPTIAAIYLIIVASTVLVKALGTSFQMIFGNRKIEKAQKINWHQRLKDLESPQQALEETKNKKSVHYQNLEYITNSDQYFPKPSEVYNAVIVATYNEPYEVLEPTLRSIAATTYDNDHLIVLLAYEERGGIVTEQTAQRLKKQFEGVFHSFDIVKHPKDMPDEVIGKGGNITFAGRYLAAKLKNQHAINYQNVIVTTLDSDNRPHPTYFDYATYEYVCHPNRKNVSYQPVSLFLNNIWDVPAPMRVIATGNSFWNIISSIRPHTLRNFASHSQPLDALIDMDFWSTRTIVEDGHQYWRSYFHFDGKYDVVPIYVPIYQDAVMSTTYVATLKAQFKQLRRWAYGASDVPYVAVRIFSRKRTVPFFSALSRLFRLIDGHVTLACIPLLVTFGGYVPQLINSEAQRIVAANQLPEVLSLLQRIAMIGLIILVFLSMKLLPPRPARYKRRRTIGMVLQWLLMPVTALVYSSAAAYNAQTRLLIGKYLDVFDVTEKATQVSIEKAKEKKSNSNRKWRFR